MKKNYSNSQFKNSFPVNFEATEYRKIDSSTIPSLIGSKVYGIVANTKGKFGTSYALACADKTSCFWLNVPSWLGKNILNDFNSVDEDCATYFNGVTITKIDKVPTKNGFDTYVIEF